MPTILAEIDKETKGELTILRNMLGLTQQQIGGLAIEYCIQQDNIGDFENWARKETNDQFDLDELSGENEPIGPDEDLFEGVRPSSTDDILDDSEEALEEAKSQTESKTFQDMMDDIDALGEPDEENND